MSQDRLLTPLTGLTDVKPLFYSFLQITSANFSVAQLLTKQTALPEASVIQLFAF
jgi:hypothetical protein